MAARAAAPPLCSMTGYGRGRAETAHADAEVELRTVNGKGLHLKLRMPNDRLALEPEVEGLLRKNLDRGSVSGGVRVRLKESATGEVDVSVLDRHLQAWRKAGKQLGLPELDPTMSDLLSLPEIYRGGEESPAVTRAVRKAILDATGEAVAALVASRKQEGARLGREIKRLTRKLDSLRKQAAKRQPAARREAEVRMQERLDQVWSRMETTAPVDLARELVLLAERADIQEELARLEIHVGRLDELLAKGGAVGRELEFLLQECQREVTTLGNKASDVQLSELVVAMKLAVQQMREQAANVE